MDLATATPVEIDTVLADLYNKQWEIGSRIEMALNDVESAVGKVLGMTFRQKPSRDQVVEVVEQAMALGERPSYEDREAFLAWSRLDEVKKRQERVEAYRVKSQDLEEDALPYEEQYLIRKWSRFFVVQGGHIHSSMRCSTCNKNGKRTQFGWIPERSGQTEAEALESLVTESAKTVLCSVCFPNAPVAWTVPREDENACKGSGSFDYDRKTAKFGYRSGWATCDHCGEVVTISSIGKIRKHKKPVAKA